MNANQNTEFDRKTALMVLQDLSHRMRPDNDIFGGKTLVISRDAFEQVRKKYLDVKVKGDDSDGCLPDGTPVYIKLARGNSKPKLQFELYCKLFGMPDEKKGETNNEG